MSTSLTELAEWVDSVAERTRPERVHWCTGSAEENTSLINQMLDCEQLLELNQDTHPECYLHRSDPDDVARVEHLTYVCTTEREDAGPNNNWMAPDDAHALMDELFDGCMAGRTMYVIAYCMGPIDSKYSRLGVEITDSAYVVANMRKMTRMGAPALARIEREGKFVRGLHSTGELDPERRFIMHFPEELAIQSYGSGYGGNALLGKKCHALRIASYQARAEGWLAEHMMIVGIENPEGETRYVAAAFPSACGKTNLAMLIPPEPYRSAGWKVHTVGDDICWLHPGSDGRLYAINPEAGFFGVAPGTSASTNPAALQMLDRDVIFTNVATTHDNQPWWEGLDDRVPERDWKGQRFDAENGPAAHPNARFTVSMTRCPSYTDAAESPVGVPIDAIIFGGRRARLAPLVLDSGFFHAALSGISHEVELSTFADGRRIDQRTGSLLWTHFGVSGPVVMDASRHWVIADAAGRKPTMTVNLLPGESFERVDAMLQPAGEGRTVGRRVGAWLAKRVADAIVRHAGLSNSIEMNQLPREGRRRLVDALTGLELPVLKHRGWNYAEVTAGGVPMAEVDYRTMGSRIVDGVHVIGEALDVDGRIGGFNFQWAWATGRLAGLAAAKPFIQ